MSDPFIGELRLFGFNFAPRSWAQCNGQLLPLGALRGFRWCLRRGDMLILIRAGRLERGQLASLIVRVRELARRSDLMVHACEHGPSDVLVQPSGDVQPLASLRGRRAVLLSAIARPASFRTTAVALGVEVVAEHRHRDHHRFTAAELAAAASDARTHDALLLTTEKDDARLAAVDVERHVLRVELRFLAAPPTAGEWLL